MKKMFLALCAVLLNLSLSYAQYPADWRPADVHGALSVKGRFLCNEQGDTITLRGVSFGWHNLWPRFYNQAALKWLKNDWKASVFRAAMGVYKGVEDGYLENPDFALNCIEPVIRAAIAEGAYVIIDWHAHDFHPEEAKAFFRKMAREYGAYPNVLYEIFNEPTHKHFWPEIKAYAEDVIAAIREFDPDNIVIVGTPSWDQHVDIAAADPIRKFDNIMYACHFYAASHKDGNRARVQKALDMGLPIFFTECAGMEHTGNGFLDIPEWTRWVEFMEKNHLRWVNWSISNKNETCSMILPRGSYEGGWADDVIKPAGIQCRKFLRQYNGNDPLYQKSGE